MRGRRLMIDIVRCSTVSLWLLAVQDGAERNKLGQRIRTGGIGRAAISELGAGEQG